MSHMLMHTWLTPPSSSFTFGHILFSAQYLMLSEITYLFTYFLIWFIGFLLNDAINYMIARNFSALLPDSRCL